MLHLRHGFTLLELLLVVFLLAALAASAVTLTDEVDVQARHELTASRRDQLRQGLLGDPWRTVNGTPVISGFVADMARLPVSVRELVEAPLDVEGNPIGWTSTFGWPASSPSSNTTSLGRGWRGPYVQPGFEIAGATQVATFRDGWGTRFSGDDALNFGWRFRRAAFAVDADDTDPAQHDLLDLGSRGRDGIDDTVSPPVSEADWDFPGEPDEPASAGDRLDSRWLIRHHDWSSPEFVGATVTVEEALLDSLSMPRVRLLVPCPDRDPALGDTNQDGWLDDASLFADPVGATPGVFQFGGGASPPARLDRVPVGVRALALVEASTPDEFLRVQLVRVLPRAALPALTLGDVP